MKRLRAFTLIELLIVVAIIAILAAIAVPNFLEAQVRSKVSRAYADMRSIATALESYSVDYNKYPPDRNHTSFFPMWAPDTHFCDSLAMVTTPVAYITTLRIPDPFLHNSERVGTDGGQFARSFKYQNTGWGGSITIHKNWGDLVANANPALKTAGVLPKAGYVLTSYGPDREYQAYEWVVAGLTYNVGGWLGVNRIYDATNGTVSVGDLGRIGGGANVQK